MQVRILTPEILDVSSAPTGGNMYFDSALGSDRNNGLSASSPKRTLTELPVSLLSGGKYYFRNGRAYGHANIPAQNGLTGRSISTTGTAVTPTEIIGWGDGDFVQFGGDVRFAAWGDVSDDFGNPFLAENGQQALAPIQATPWDQHFIGLDALTPSFWSPSCSDNLPNISRHQYFQCDDGSEVGYDMPRSLVQDWTGADTATVSRDPALVDLPESWTYTVTPFNESGAYQTTMYIKHPKIAEWYGDTSGPVGAALAFRCDPANFFASAYITEYDYEQSMIVAKTSGATQTSLDQRLRPYKANRAVWWILGHPFDLRQAGQYACTVFDGEPYSKVWRVAGDWQRGRPSMSMWGVGMQLVGNYVRTDNVMMGRARGYSKRIFATESLVNGQGFSAAGLLLSVNGAHYFSNFGARNGLADNPESVILGTGALSVAQGENLKVSECWSVGGVRGPYAQGDIDGADLCETGRTALYDDSTTGGMLNISNVTYYDAKSFHGNGVTLYVNAANVRIQNMTVAEGIRAFTSQAGPDWPVEANKQLINAHMPSLRPYSTTVGAAISSYVGTSDTGWSGSLLDRVVDADSAGFRMRAGNKTSDNGRVHRSWIGDLLADNDYPRGTPPGEVLTFEDTVLGSRGTTDVAARGLGSIRVEVVPYEQFTGTLSESQWRTLSQTEADHTIFEPFLYGDNRHGWTIPAYNPTTKDTGSPIELKLSKTYFYRGCQPGTTIAHVWRGRPMSQLSIVEDFGDADDFIFDQGRLVIIVRPDSATRQIKIRETPRRWNGAAWALSASEARDTTFTLTARL